MKKPQFSLDALEPYFDKIEKLPKLHRMLISCLLFALIGCAFFFLMLKPQFRDIEKNEKELKKLEKDLQTAKRSAKDLKKFQKEIKDAETQFKIVMKSLPEKEEIPSLLTSISDSGRNAGLEFVLFEPQNEQSKDFYAELPVAMTVNGNFHNVALEILACKDIFRQGRPFIPSGQHPGHPNGTHEQNRQKNARYGGFGRAEHLMCRRNV